MKTSETPAEPEPPEPALSKSQITWAVGAMALLLLLPFPFVSCRHDAPSEYGALLQGLASTAALALLLLTLHLQRRELHLQREELRNQRKEMKANTEEQKGQREAMTAQLEEMRRQNTLLIEQHDLRLRPILEARSSASAHFNFDLQNSGFERGYVNRVQIRTISNAQDETENISSVLNALVDRFGIRQFLTHAASANNSTPRLLKVGEGYPVLDLSLDWGKAKAEDMLSSVRAFYAALSEYEIVADTTDIRNQQPQEFRFDLRRFLSRIGLPEN